MYGELFGTGGYLIWSFSTLLVRNLHVACLCNKEVSDCAVIYLIVNFIKGYSL